MSEIPAQVTLPYTRVHSLTADSNSQQYKLFIALPLDYNECENTYPVLYKTDANGTFAWITQMARVMQLPFAKELPEIIIVGIGYPVSAFRDAFDLRGRDLTPTSHESVPGSGGAEYFLTFIRDQVIPFVESTYRADPEDRALEGYSYGGLFGLYSMFTQPQIFRRYIVGGPSIGYDNQVLLQFEEQYAKGNKDLPARTFMGVGGLESPAALSAFWRLISAIKSREYENMVLETHVFPDETHISAGGAILNRGLRFIYAA